MAINFVPTSVVKGAKRIFTAPIVSASVFDANIAAVTGADNPLDTVSFQSSGATVPGAVVGSESYKATVMYVEPVNGKTVGSLVLTAPTRSACDAIVTDLLAATAITAQFGEGVDAVQDTAKSNWNVVVKLHDPNGENYTLTFTRKELRIGSYEDDAILAKVETWADTVSSLN